MGGGRGVWNSRVIRMVRMWLDLQILRFDEVRRVSKELKHVFTLFKII